MQILVSCSGIVRCVYGEAFPLRSLGKISISRGSHVEPTEDGRWTADLSPVDGPLLGPFDSRASALSAEYDWLQRNWLASASQS